MIIYSISEFDQRMRCQSSDYYASLNGVCNYIMAKSPIDNKMTVYDRGIAGLYDINPDNLKYLIEQNKINEMNVMFSITSDFFVTRIKTTLALSTIKVKD